MQQMQSILAVCSGGSCCAARRCHGGCGRRHHRRPARHPTCSRLLLFAGRRYTNQAWHPTRDLVGDECCWPVQRCCCASAALWQLMAQQQPPSRRQPPRRQQRQMARQAVQATVVRGAELRAELAESALQPIRVVCLPSQPLGPCRLVVPAYLLLCHARRCGPFLPPASLAAALQLAHADPHWNWDVWYGDLKPYKDHKFRHDYWYQVRS